MTSLWDQYGRLTRRRRMRTGFVGLVWVILCTALAVAAWQGGSSTAPTGPLLLLALFGWVAVAASFQGTIVGLLIRFALLGAAAGFAAFALPALWRDAGGPSWLLAGLVVLLAQQAVSGLKKELAARDRASGSLVIGGGLTTVVDDPDAWQWFVSRRARIAVRLKPEEGRRLVQRLSARDQRSVSACCAECFADRDLTRAACQACSAVELLVLYDNTAVAAIS